MRLLFPVMLFWALLPVTAALAQQSQTPPSYYEPRTVQTASEPSGAGDAPVYQRSPDYGPSPDQGYQQPAAEQQGPVYEYDERFRNFPPPDKEDKDIVKLLPFGSYSIYFKPDKGLKAGKALLRVTSQNPVTGCVKIDKSTLKVKEEGPSQIYKIAFGDVKVDRTAHYAHYQCQNAAGYPHVDIPLDLAEMKEKGITRLGLESESYPVADYFDIEASADHIGLTPHKTPRFFHPLYAPDRADPLVFRFAPSTPDRSKH